MPIEIFNITSVCTRNRQHTNIEELPAKERKKIVVIVKFEGGGGGGGGVVVVF